MRTLLATTLLAVALPCLAQEGGFGLDLTGETQPEQPPPPPASKKKKTPPPPTDAADAPVSEEAPAQADGATGFGLDLSGDSVELRAPLAFAGVRAAPDASKADVELAQWLEARILEGAMKSGGFARVMKPDWVNQTLGVDADKLAQCTEATCFEEAADTLDAERLLRAELRREPSGPKVKVWSYARGGAPQSEDIAIIGQGKASAWTALRPAYRILEGLTTHLAELTVKPNDPTAESRYGDRMLGKGERKELVPAGTATLRVTGDGLIPYEEPLTLAPDEQKTMEVALRAMPREAVVATRAPRQAEPAPAGPPGPSIFNRPGLYVAAAGLLAVGIGGALGASAMGTQRRAVDADGNGVIDITRAEMLGARQGAMAANVLFGLGGAAIVGGGTWFVLSGRF